jgi:GAF domain-containing protein
LLYLGPFQGKIACTKIKLGSGVCGTAAQKCESIIVPDVNQFPGHIFCDPDSKSEIVIPIVKNNNLIGVLDLDSDSYNSFNETDQKYLEEIVKFLTEEII